MDNDVTVCVDLKDVDDVPMQLSLQQYPNRESTYHSVNFSGSINRTINNASTSFCDVFRFIIEININNLTM